MRDLQIRGTNAFGSLSSLFKMSLHFQNGGGRMNTFQEFEGGIKVSLTYIDPDYEVNLVLPDENKWRFIGNYEPTEGSLFMKRYSRHLHKILNSWGVSAYVIEMLESRGLRKLILYLEDTKEVWETTLENLKQEGVWKFWKEGGFDRQCFLALPYWVRKK